MPSSVPTLDYASPVPRPARGKKALDVVAIIVAIPLAVALAEPPFAPAWGYRANNPAPAILATAAGLFYVWRRLWRGPYGVVWGIAQGVLATIGILAVAAQIVTFKDDPGHPRPLLRLELLIPSVVAAGAILLFGIARLALRLTGGRALHATRVSLNEARSAARAAGAAPSTEGALK